jgi:RHS repeat-associated protein
MRKRLSRRRPWVAAVTAAALLGGGVTLTAVPPRTGAPSGTARAAADVSVASRPLRRVAPAADPERVSVAALPAAHWPQPGSADVVVTPGKSARAGHLPVELSGTGGAAGPAMHVHVEVLDQATARALGGVGVALRLSGGSAAGPVDVTVDYSGFARAFGGNLADRLRLERVPACAPAGCRFTPRPVNARNDLPAGRLTARVDAGSSDILVVTTAASGSGTGDYRATDLRPSAKWQVGLQSGSFTESYPLTLPPSVGGDPPEVALEYNSGSVDGRTSATNNQASWVGLGWDLGMGFIERQYKSCVDDGDPFHADRCWSSPYSNDEDGAAYVISLDGVSTELIKTSDGTFRMRDDRGWKVEHLFGGPNADNTGEYWVVSTPDGVKHYFGQRTDSNWTVPVVGDDAGEPCHATAPVPCRQTWRWNLDKTVDPNGNVTAVYWTKETNNYTQANGGATYKYDRGGYLDRIEYGMRDGEHAAAQVDFIATPRCTQRVTDPTKSCPAATPSAGSSYPDVPVDLICLDGTTCTKPSPSFFVTSRLESIATKVWDVPTSTWQEVNRWTPRFSFPASPDGTSPSLWLNSIQQSGSGGVEPVTLPPTEFDGVFLINRQDYTTTAQQLQMRRLSVIRNGMGGETRITYGHGSSTATCPAGGENTNWEAGVLWDQNHYECFRVRFKPEGSTTTTKGVFHKYVVTKVDEVDLVGGSPTMTTTYSYGVDQLVPWPAWHREDDLLKPAAEEDWTDWRGYQTVRVTEGSGGADRQTITDTRYFQGMNGDLLASGTPKTATVTDYSGHAWPDDQQFAGQVLQTQQYRKNADGTLTELESQRHTFWDSGIIADGPGLHDVRMVRPEYTYSRDRRADGTWRETVTLTDGYSVANGGLATREADLGETGVADSTCTETSYAQNTSGGRWMLDYPEIKEVHSGDPGVTAGCPGPVVDRTVTLYDGATAPGDGNNEPTAGNQTEVRSYSSDTTYSRVTHTYDAYGRELTETDVDGTTTTSYSPATGFPTGGVTETDPAGFTTTTFPCRSFQDVDDKTVDANGLVTTYEYDGVGRLRRVWLPTEAKTPTNTTPSYEFTYRITATGTAQPTKPTVVTSKQLQTLSGATAGWLPTYTYLDGFGRTREVQTPSPGPSGGRTVTVTTYDDRGLVRGTSAPMWNSTAPADNPDLMLNPATTAIPSWTEKTYDALERETVSTVFALGVATATMTTANYGNGTVVTPPTGGSTAIWLDGHDRKAIVQQGVSAGATAPQAGVPTTSYTYTPDGEDDITSITDAAGDVMTYTYDWLGRRLTTHDPNAGTETSTYDAAGRITSTVDARGTKVSYTYDSLGRRRVAWSGEPQTGTKLAEWTYDTVPGGKGKLATATRYVAGNAYKVEVTDYDERYRVTGRRWTIPANEGALAGTYDITYGYDHADHRTDTTYPAVGGLPAETVHQSYTPAGTPDTLTSELGTYVASTAYTGSGQLTRRDLGSTGSTRRTYTWEDTGQRRLTGITTTTGADTATPTVVQDDAYTYDAVGNILRVLDRTTGQSQCSTYDVHNRLTASWTTAAADCSGGVASADGFGPDPFAQQYTYDLTGNITSVTTGTGTRDYSYPDPGTDAVRPQAVSSIGSDTYSYDAAGNQTSRTVGGVTTTSTYDEFGRLATSTTGGATTSFVYDADGTRLLRRAPGATTLYLDGTELTDTGGTVTATRYYTVGGGMTADTAADASGNTGGDTVAMRTPAGTTWLAADQQGSVQLAVDPATGTVSRQRYLPYGEHRGGRDDIAVTDHGYLGKVEDSSTELVALDNREHDPATGRLTSPDPLLDTEHPTNQNAYAYAADNPVTLSDPSGLRTCWDSTDCPIGGDIARFGGHPPKKFLRDPAGYVHYRPPRRSCWGWECTHRTPVARSTKPRSGFCGTTWDGREVCRKIKVRGDDVLTGNTGVCFVVCLGVHCEQKDGCQAGLPNGWSKKGIFGIKGLGAEASVGTYSAPVSQRKDIQRLCFFAVAGGCIATGHRNSGGRWWGWELGFGQGLFYDFGWHF